MIVPPTANDANSREEILLQLAIVAEPQAMPAIVARFYEILPPEVASRFLDELRRKRAAAARQEQIGGRE